MVRDGAGWCGMVRDVVGWCGMVWNGVGWRGLVWHVVGWCPCVVIEPGYVVVSGVYLPLLRMPGHILSWSPVRAIVGPLDQLW